ncbi:MAG: gluconokinase [Verrucomicrobia bacterium]|nr:gluconokinase [Verrucomicrobiota bacterium]MBV9672443.1 gluconokinase [Verrucomicrobiota bacterium]
MPDDNAKAFIVMGVSGCGKTEIGSRLAHRIGVEFLDGDTFHSPGNVSKMHRGIPLTDEDRWPWLQHLHREIVARLSRNESVVLGCSALKRSYRQVLKADHPNIWFIFLEIDRETVWKRLSGRTGHFFPKELMDSQFEALEEPENAIKIDARPDVETIVSHILREIEKLKEDGQRS